jgi:hypothetical protein
MHDAMARLRFANSRRTCGHQRSASHALYQQKVINLAEALNDEPTRLEATECLRDLIEEIRLVPENGKLRIELYGELASLINLANGNPRSKEGTGVQVTLVAGARNHLNLQLRLLTSAALPAGSNPARVSDCGSVGVSHSIPGSGMISRISIQAPGICRCG